MATPIERFRGDTAPDQVTFNQNITGLTFRLTLNTLEDPPDVSTQVLQMVGTITNPVTGIVEFRPTLVEATGLTPGVYFYDIQVYNAFGVVIKTAVKDSYTILQDITKEND